jgi:protein-S-isoprenylcysteine O-methyltransferase Ste14
MYIGILISLTGAALVATDWNQIHKNYWSKEKGQEQRVTTGIYRYIRHPQYTGFFMISLGMMLEWATLSLIILYSLLLVLYYKLAKKEKMDIEKEFGSKYIEYKKHTKMFIPYII